jgi:hypothetical protein
LGPQVTTGVVLGPVAVMVPLPPLMVQVWVSGWVRTVTP